MKTSKNIKLYKLINKSMSLFFQKILIKNSY